MRTHRWHLSCTWEPGKEIAPVPSHKEREEVSQVEAEDRKSEPGLGRDVPRPGAERQGRRWAQTCGLWFEVGVPGFRRGRGSHARDHLVRDLVQCLTYSQSKREVLMGLRQERDRSEENRSRFSLERGIQPKILSTNVHWAFSERWMLL